MKKCQEKFKKLKETQKLIVQALDEQWEYEECKKLVTKAKPIFFKTKEHEELIGYTKTKKLHFRIEN
jgi:hypothetical protein